MHDEKLRHKYELQEKAIRDYNSSLLAAREEAGKQGWEKVSRKVFKLVKKKP